MWHMNYANLNKTFSVAILRIIFERIYAYTINNNNSNNSNITSNNLKH